MVKISAMGLGRWLSKKVLSTQTRRPEFGSQACLYKASVIPTLVESDALGLCGKLTHLHVPTGGHTNT